MNEKKSLESDLSEDMLRIDKAVADIDTSEKNLAMRTQRLYKNIKNAVIIGIAAAIISVPCLIVASYKLHPAQNETYHSVTSSLEQSINDNPYSGSASSISAPINAPVSTEAPSTIYNKTVPAELLVQQQSPADSAASKYAMQFESIKAVLETDRIKADLMMDDLKNELSKEQGSAAQQILSQATEYEKNILHPILEKSYQIMYDETQQAFENSDGDNLSTILNESEFLVNELNRSNSSLIAKAEQLMQDIQYKCELIEKEKIEEAKIASENNRQIEEENSLASHFESDYAQALQLYNDNKMDLSAMLLEESIAEMQAWNASGKEGWIAKAKKLYDDNVFQHVEGRDTWILNEISNVQNMDKEQILFAVQNIDSDLKSICFDEYPPIKAAKAQMVDYFNNTLLPQLEPYCSEKYDEYAELLPNVLLEQIFEINNDVRIFMQGCEAAMPYSSEYVEKARLLSAQYEQKYQDEREELQSFTGQLNLTSDYMGNRRYEDALRLFNELIPLLQSQKSFDPTEYLNCCYSGIEQCYQGISAHP